MGRFVTSAHERQLEVLIAPFNEKQQAFLRAKAEGKTDKDACIEANVTRQSVWRWQEKQPDFLRVYNTLVEEVEMSLVPVKEEDRQAVLKLRISEMTSALPAIVQENIRLALNGQSESVRIKAIELLYKTVGLSAERLLDPNSFDGVTKQLASWMHNAMQRAAPSGKIDIELEAEDLIGLPDGTIEGQFEEVSDDRQD